MICKHSIRRTFDLELASFHVASIASGKRRGSNASSVKELEVLPPYRWQASMKRKYRCTESKYNEFKPL